MSENSKANISKPRIFSGIQPSGNITIGNYYGALKNWVEMQNDYESLFCVVDLHAITVRQDPAKLRAKTRELMALYIATGLDPDTNILYPQSSVRQHSELAWILNCFTYMGELNRMTQFKDKSSKNETNINAGLYTYPVLMAADILLYQTDVVPIGVDQKQHLELARDLAERFNHQYSDTFKVPEPFFGKVGAKIKSLQDPMAKMSKSDENPNGAIALLDPPNIIANKLKRAVTDSLGVINYSEDQAGVKNLIDIYCCASGESIERAMNHFEGQNYGFLKTKVTDAVVSELEPIQKRYNDIIKDKAYLDTIIKNNSERASLIAEKTLRKVKKKVGFIV
jgi:tryptophanyl-tRNA synthetase